MTSIIVIYENPRGNILICVRAANAREKEKTRVDDDGLATLEKMHSGPRRSPFFI